MDKKIKHRILGILAIIGVIVISLPLFQNQSIQSETSLAKAPPFPNPTSPSLSTENNQTQVLKQPEATSLQDKDKPNQQPDDTISVVRPTIVNAATPDLSYSNPPKENNEVAHNDRVEMLPVSFDNKHTITTGSSFITHPKNQPIHHNAAMQLTSNKTTHQTLPTSSIDNSVNRDSLIGTKNTAWAIQLGSFKNKKNALRLVNHLRENGYRAFIRQVPTSFGENTRVYVGPELKRVLAHQLALQLENDLHIKGMIIRYQPLSL